MSISKKQINNIPYPYIGMFDLDLIYQISDTELLYQLINKINEIAISLNNINNDIEYYTKKILDEYLADGKLSISTSYDPETGTLTFNFTNLGG